MEGPAYRDTLEKARSSTATGTAPTGTTRFAGYGNAGGARAIEQLRMVAVESAPRRRRASPVSVPCGPPWYPTPRQTRPSRSPGTVGARGDAHRKARLESGRSDCRRV